jgi:hypothetical protein
MNKCNKGWLVAVAATLGAFASGVALADTKNIDINASVTGVCKFNTTASNPVITIGPIDPSGSGDVTGSVAVVYKCTKGTSPGFTVPTNTTLNCTAGGCAVGTDTLAVYSITSTNDGAGSGFGSGQDKNLNVTAKVQQSDYQNATVGSYTKTITVSVSP